MRQYHVDYVRYKDSEEDLVVVVRPELCDHRCNEISLVNEVVLCFIDDLDEVYKVLLFRKEPSQVHNFDFHRFLVLAVFFTLLLVQLE